MGEGVDEPAAIDDGGVVDDDEPGVAEEWNDAELGAALMAGLEEAIREERAALQRSPAA